MGLVFIRSLEPLEEVHRRAAKIIHNISDTTSDVEIPNKAKWKSIFYMYKKGLITLTHQAYYENAPDVINKLVSKQERNRPLRDNQKFNYLDQEQKLAEGLSNTGQLFCGTAFQKL